MSKKYSSESPKKIGRQPEPLISAPELPKCMISPMSTKHLISPGYSPKVYKMVYI